MDDSKTTKTIQLAEFEKTGRILLECTLTYQHGFRTGISRVVHGIVGHAAQFCGQFGIECQTVIFRDGKIHAVSLSPQSGADAVSMLEKKSAAIFSRIVQSMPSLHSFLTGTSLGRFATYLCKKIMGSVKSIATSLAAGDTSLKINPDDLIVMLDSSWQACPWNYLATLRKNGTTISAVLHDMIPVRFPEFFHADIVEAYRNWLTKAGRGLDFFIANSNATRDDFLNYMREHGKASKDLRVTVFRLGADLQGKSAAGEVRPAFREIFRGDNRPFLIVSTIEPRKNHAFLLDAFELAWNEGVNARLAIIGKVGWMCEPLVERIRSHRRFGRDLFMFNDANDAEVAFTYENARAMVFPSIAEGFGLPIVESLSRHLPVLASDIPVHREVGGNFCTYFPLASPARLAELIRQSVRDTDFLKRPAPGEFSWPTWQESTLIFLEKILSAWLRNDPDMQL